MQNKYRVLQSIVGTSPLTGQEISYRPGEQIEWDEKEIPAMIEAGILAPVVRTMETPESVKPKTKHKETR